MVKVTLTSFMGMLPSRDPSMLPPGAATVALNCRLRSGGLFPFRAPAVAQTLLADAVDFHPIAGTFRGFPAAVSVAHGPIAEDRYYISGDGVPTVNGYETGEEFSYPLKLAAPTAKPTRSRTGTLDPDTTESVVFAYTFLTDLDEESPPSPVSNSIALSEGVTIAVGGFAAPPSGRGIDRRRIYRSVSQVDGTTLLQFLTEIPLATTSYDYVVSSTAVGEAITTDHYAPIPDTAEGFTTMPNGVIAAFDGRDLLFCEPFRPHAWPVDYRLKTDFPIVALVTVGTSGLAVLTTGTPYLVQGLDPETMAMTRFEERLPCIAARGAVDLGFAAAYPSTEGLVTIGEGGAQLVTRGLFTRDKWLDLVPSTIVAAQYEGRYAFFYNDGVEPTPRIAFIDLTGESPFFSETDIEGMALNHDITTGDLYLLDEDARTIRRFDDRAAAPMTMTWTSGRLDIGFAATLGAIRVEGEPISGRSLTVTVSGDGTSKGAATALRRNTRLQDGLHDTYQITATGTQPISRIEAATTMDEMIG